MMKTLYKAGLVLALALVSLSSSATPEKLLAELQHMRLASLGAMTDFFMFTSLDADSKYDRRIQEDISNFATAMENARSLVASETLVTQLDTIENDWTQFVQSLNSNRNLVLNQGYPSVQMVDEMGRLNNGLVGRISDTYKDIEEANGLRINPAVDKARGLAILLQEMTTQYAATGAIEMAEVHMGQYKRSLETMTKDFEIRLADLKNMAQGPNTSVLITNIGSKWRFLRNSISRQHEMAVPFLVISYNDRIIRHLEELEGKI